MERFFWSRRTAFDRAPNLLSQRIAAHRALAGDVPLFDLSSSNPTSAGLPYDAELFGALADARARRYRPEPFGLLEARNVAAAYFEKLAPSAPPLDAEHILLTASTSEAYALLFKLLCDPGDTVAIPEPSYPLFDHLATLEGVRLVPYRLAYDGAWHVDLDSLRAALGGAVSSPARARAIVVVSPNNPTGTYLKRDELAALSAFGVPIVSDEVFAEYSFRDAPESGRVASARERTDVLTFTMGGLSKSCGLPQLKLAWTAITGPAEDVREAVERLEIVADAYLSPSAPVQLALPTLLERGGTTRRAIRARVSDHYRALGDAFDGSPCTLLHAEGGWTACVRLPRTRSEEAWVLGLLEKERVLVQPGAFYDFADEPILIVSLLTEPSVFREGVERLVRHVTQS